MKPSPYTSIIRAFMLLFSGLIVVGMLNLPIAAQAAGVPHLRAGAQDWPMYLHDLQHTNASGETLLSTANAGQLAKLWAYKTGNLIATSPAVVNGVVYIGAWDGYEYALDAVTGAFKWKTFLGTTNAPQCQNQPATLGITSGATVINGTLYVGGGDRYWYALDLNGNILWKVDTGDTTQGYYNWSSPLIYNGYAYVGTASNCDDPLIQGQLLKVNLTTHVIDAAFSFVPNGQIGGGVWTTPALDTTNNTLFMTTGTQSLLSQGLAQAMVAVDATTLALKGAWTIPHADTVDDSDWGSSPVVFTDKNGRRMVAGINKNGYLYAFDENNITAGPVWRDTVAVGGDCPQCGGGSISSGIFVNGKLYFAGGATTIGGVGYLGSVRQVDPTTGAIQWEHGAPGAILGALAWDNGLIVAPSGKYLEVLDASNGHRLYSYRTGGFYGSPAISNGTIFIGSLDTYMYAFAPTAPTPPPADPNCPAGWTCQDVGAPTPAGSETVSGNFWTLSASGTGIGVVKASDQFRFISKNVSGDLQLVTELTAQQSVVASTATGLMLRQNTDPGAPYYGIYRTADGRLLLEYRNAFGIEISVLGTINGTTIPRYLMIQRVGDTYSAATSTDGVNYTVTPGSTINFPMPMTVMAGVVHSSASAGNLGTATVTQTAVGAITITPTPAPPLGTCPTGWTCGDIGNPLKAGTESATGGTWTVQAAGTDYGFGTSDQFRYIWQAISGDATLTAHVASVTNTATAAKAGVMFRENASASAAFYSISVTPGVGVMIIYRPVNGINVSIAAQFAGTAPAYLRITRHNDLFTAYSSTDGTTWTVIADSSVNIQMANPILGGVSYTAHNTTTLGTAVFDTVSLTAGAPLPPGACPTNWTCGDVGAPDVTGTQNATGTSWTVLGAGGDMFGTVDQFHFLWQTLGGDATISARVVSQSNTDPSAKAGVMLRQNTDTDAAYYALLVTPANGTIIQYRTAKGNGTAQISVAPTGSPKFLRVTRSGNTFTAYTSADGVTWTAVPGSSIVITMTNPMLGGLDVTSHNPGQLSSVVYDNIALTSSAPLPPGACPTGWSCADVGSPDLAGTQDTNGTTWTVSGAGGDIFGTVDQFHYLYKQLNGDGTVSAQVTSQTNTDPSAKAGVMLRQSTATDAAYYALFVTPGSGLIIQYRTAAGNGTMQSTVSVAQPPVYIQVARSGNTFTAYTSADGVAWTAVPGSSVAITMTNPILAGLSVTAHNPGQLSSVGYANVAITTSAPLPPGGCPTNWTCADVGNPDVTGTQSINGGTWTLLGAGGDMFGTIDQFRFISQQLSGDGSIAARVVSQTNTDPSAKAGVMLRQSTATDAAYYAILVTPGNGVIIQYRTANGNGTVQNTVSAATVPIYVRVARTGNTFMAYTSADGITWAVVPGSAVAITMTNPILAGVNVTSHNSGQLSSVVFDHVVFNTTLPVLANACPSGWNCGDIGNPNKVGGQVFDGATWLLQGAGGDIFGTTDQGRFVWQTVTGDATMSATVVSQTNTNDAAKAGVMLRQSTAANGAYYAVFVSPGKGIIVQYRLTSGGTTSQIKIAGTAPLAVRIVRTGDSFTAFTSADGITWTPVAKSTVTLTMTGPVLAGLVVTSHNAGALSAVVFNQVALA